MHKLHGGLVQPLVNLFTPPLTLPHIPLHLIHDQGPSGGCLQSGQIVGSVWRNQVKGWGHGYDILYKYHIRIIPVNTTRR